MQYIYLHGFASGNNALKANFFKAQMAKLGLDLIIPDLNEDDFTNLTLTRQIETVKRLIDPDTSVVLFGSSMGGLLALTLAEQLDNITKLILFAPAIQMAKRWTRPENKEKLDKWRQDGSISVYHYGYEKDMPLNYSFITDLVKYKDQNFTKAIPTLIFHGTQDTSVPHTLSANYAAGKSYVTYHELDSDHSLENKVKYMWSEIQPFIL